MKLLNVIISIIKEELDDVLPSTIGFEMDKGYYDIACKRIEEHEGV